MPPITRRHLLAGAAATVAAAAAPFAVPALVEAAAPAIGKQAPGVYRYKVGSIEVTVVTDGANRIPLTDGFVLNASKADVNAALAAEFLEQDFFTGPYNPIVVNNGGKLALIDTGTGEAAYIASKGMNGQLLTNLPAAGIDRNAIDTVIISHFHGDHINGILKADNSLAFPNAEILVPAREHAYWMSDDEMRRARTPRIEANFKNVRRIMTNPEVQKKLRPYEWEQEIFPGITAVATPGQTPGHTAHIIASGNSKVFVHGDVTHAPYLFVRNPGWHVFFDHDPVMAEATRRKVYDMLAAEKMMVQGYHFPFPALVNVIKTPTGYREIPVGWKPQL